MVRGIRFVGDWGIKSVDKGTPLTFSPRQLTHQKSFLGSREGLTFAKWRYILPEKLSSVNRIERLKPFGTRHNIVYRHCHRSRHISQSAHLHQTAWAGAAPIFENWSDSQAEVSLPSQLISSGGIRAKLNRRVDPPVKWYIWCFGIVS